MFDKITDGITGFVENIGDLAERTAESVGLVDKDPAYVSLKDGNLRHNIDLDGFSDEQVAEIESILAPFAHELEAIEQELSNNPPPERRSLLEARKSEIQGQLTEVKWEIEHQQFNFGKAFFGSMIPGGGVIAQGIGFDGDSRIESAVELLTPTAEDAGATISAASPSADQQASDWTTLGDGEIDEMVTMITREPEALMERFQGLSPEQRPLVMASIQQKLQEINQMSSMMSNFQKSMHDTQKAVLNNFRV